MPRQAHGRSLLATGPAKTKKRKPAKGRALNALETAERDFPEKIKIRQHRLGEEEDDDDDNQNTRTDNDERSAKRRKVDNTADNADSADEGSDPDGNPWHVGVDDDDEDSDIDSDEAFGESDEERFADFTFRGSSQPNTQPKQSVSKQKSKPRPNLDLDEEAMSDSSGESDDGDGEGGISEDDDLGDEAVDLAAAWDMDDEDLRREEERVARKQKSLTVAPKRKVDPPSDDGSDGSVDSSVQDTSSDQDQSAQSDVDISDEDADKDTTARLRSFVDSLTPAQLESRSQRSTTHLRALPNKPSPFALASTPISAADLMQYVTDPTQRQSLKLVQAAGREQPSIPKGGIPGKLAAPLAKRQQDRLDRVAAYDQAKQTLDRWVDTVKQNRRAEHVSFPLPDATKDSASAIKSFQPLARAGPQSELESKILEIMQESGLNQVDPESVEKGERVYEELKEKHLPLEEVQARRRELRMQRELMFREEIRAKRIKKIKSKAFRRVHRKERDKFAVQERERLAAAGVIDSDEEREKNDKRRAEERMGARHRESKWAKAAKASGQTTWNDDAKVGVSELARRDEELRKRIEGKTMHGSEDSGSDGDTESSYGGDSGTEDARWSEKLDSLKHVTKPTGKSKLADMAFMKKAEAEQKAQNDEELRLLRRGLVEADASDTASDNDELPTRQKYGKQSTKASKLALVQMQRLDFEERLSDDETAPQNPEVPEVTEQSTRAAPENSHTSTAALTQPQKSSKSQTRYPAINGKATSATKRILPKSSSLDDYTSPSESEGDTNHTLDDKDKLALDIFAGDDEVELRKQFQKEKKQAVREDGDQIIDNSLPGWGNWAGAGVSKKEQKKGKFLTTVKGVAPEARKDARLDRVIVNEKRNKKNGKYMATELPHPFESRQQYERSLRLPMGPEWSTRNHFQDAIKPRVLVKQGQVIKPMAKPLS